jgi:polyketide synthase PksN
MKDNKKQSYIEKDQEELQGKPLQEKQTDIAVIGMACRFPGARDYEEFWQNLKQGRSSIQEIPRER